MGQYYTYLTKAGWAWHSTLYKKYVFHGEWKSLPRSLIPIPAQFDFVDSNSDSSRNVTDSGIDLFWFQNRNRASLAPTMNIARS